MGKIHWRGYGFMEPHKTNKNKLKAKPCLQSGGLRITLDKAEEKQSQLHPDLKRLFDDFKQLFSQKGGTQG